MIGDTALPGTPQNPFNIPGLPGAIVIPGLTPTVTPSMPLPTPASADAGLISVAASSYNQMTPAAQEQFFGFVSSQGGGGHAFMTARLMAAGIAGAAGVLLAFLFARKRG